MLGIGKKKKEVENNVEENGVKDAVSEDAIIGFTHGGGDNEKIDNNATISGDFDIPEPEDDSPAPLTWKEAKALKRSRYEEKIAHNDKFKKAYIIRNRRTNQVVELRAASPFHAANIIGWKPSKVEIIGVKDIESPLDEPETVGKSSEVEV